MLQNKSQSSILRLLLIGAGTIIILVGLRTFADVISPAILAGFLALLCIPLYQWFQKKGLSSGVSLLLLILILLGIAVGLALLVLTSFRVLLDSLPEYTNNMQAEVAQIADSLNELGLDGESAENAGDRAVSLLSSIAASMLGNAIGLILVGVVVLILLIFIIAESSQYPQRLRRGLGEDNDLLPRIRAFRQSLINYFVARFKVNAITGTAVFIMLLVVDVDFALLWGILAIFLSFIPYFGLIIAAIPGVLLAFAQYGAGTAVLVAIGYLIINQVIEQIVAPKIIADDISLSPALTFFALIFWAFIFEFLGVLLAAPLTVLVVLIMQSYSDTRWLALMAIADEKEQTESVEKEPE